MKTVIMAGGKGSRIADVLTNAGNIPKPMLKIEGKPILEHEIECLRKQGFTDIIFTVSHLGHVIMDYFQDGSGISPSTGKPFGVNISYFQESVPLGNAGALFQMQEQLTEDFLLLNADVMFDVDFQRFVQFHKEHQAMVTLFTHPNSHPYDSGLLVAEADGSVKQWLTKEDPRPRYYKNRVNAGLHALSPLIFQTEAAKLAQTADKIDLDRQLLKPLAGTGRMFCYDSPEYVKDMGTPERYEAVCQDFHAGLVTAKNLQHKQKAIFLDRDGTLNKPAGFLSNIDDFVLLPNVADAINRIHAAGYLAIVVTNQPVLARGELSFLGLQEIHYKLETLLGLEGAYIDGLYFCPHHPHKGYEGEVAELKIECSCRKPKPGMLLQAAADFHIDCAQSWMVGDAQTDIGAGKAAGCKTALLADSDSDFGQDLLAASLLAFCDALGI